MVPRNQDKSLSESLPWCHPELGSGSPKTEQLARGRSRHEPKATDEVIRVRDDSLVRGFRIVWFYVFTALVITLFGCQSGTPLGRQAPLPEKVDFNFHIKPILSDRCFKCHGPDEKVRKADLRFDVKEGAFALLDSAENRYAIVPGNLKKSQLVRRISSTDPDFMMPHPESNLSLSNYEIALLKRWIEQGAEWKPHWSFIPPQKAASPEVENAAWPRNPIDHFILAKMETEGLQPSEEAEKTYLIRRLSFDLTGLPPTLEEVDAFLADDSPQAYEKMIDHYLAAPAYGERMTVPWLDLARYADTHGYQDDLDRTMWPWRDWVIKAFNENMPFDQFATWQLAGDLLPDPTYEQKLATGFNRNHAITVEGGVIDEEYRVEYVVDRAQTTATTFLGLTLQCARCHDHKFDPISQKEFYQLFSFFNSVPEKGQASYSGTPEPNMPLPEEQIEAIKASVKKDIDKAKAQLAAVRTEKRATSQTPFEQWVQQHRDPNPAVTTTLPRGRIAHYNFDYFEGERVANLVNPARPGKLINDVTEAQGRFSGGVEFNGKGDKDQLENHIDFGNTADFDIYDPFTFSFWWNYHSQNNGTAIISKIDRSTHKGYQIIQGARWMQLNIGGPRGITLQGFDSLIDNEWIHVAITYDGSGRASGFKIYYDGKLQSVKYFPAYKGIGPHTRIAPGTMRTTAALLAGKEGSEDRQRLRAPLSLDELQIYNRALSAEEVLAVLAYDPVAHLLRKEVLSNEENESLFRHYLHHHDSDYQAAVRALGHEKRIEQQVKEQLLPVMIMQEMDTLRPAYVLTRGAYDAPEERVYPGTPSAVLDFSTALPPNRLGLAEWLFDPQNPLTARVIVNRFWHLTFGEGIVSTVDDFGSQGALPTHPALLDWLAVEFIESGWDVKHVLKLMVRSATYRQSSRVDPKSRQKDPQNIYLARSPQYRLPAEMIRDNVLAVSGLLVAKMGGPSVKPYQPPGLWAEVSSGRGTKTYFQQKGEALYRKSLYTFWKRTVPPPSMITFDAATRNYCLPKRQTTSTPLQALVLLNDPQVLEAARVFAERMMVEGGDGAESRIAFGFRTATSRYPKKEEINLLTDLLNQEKAIYQADPGAAAEFLSVGEKPIENDFDPAELAAYTQVASAIFNLDETFTKY